MAAQSGIRPSDQLLEAWSQTLSSADTRLIKLAIEQEQVVEKSRHDVQGSFEDDFSLFNDDNIVDVTEPAYYLYRLEPSTDSQWIFYSFVPDEAPVRSKMLYASSRTTCARLLGDQRFITNLFATTRKELTHEAYVAHDKSQQADVPMSEREKEMQQIQQAEAKERREGTFADPTRGRSMLDSGNSATSSGAGAAIGLPWSDEAEDCARKIVEDEIDQAQFEIDKERIIPVSLSPTSLSLPSSSPSYTIYRHSKGIVFIYCCPASSPIKSRLVYSSSASAAVSHAKSLGIDIIKKLETSDPDEVTDEYILQELGGEDVASRDGSGTATPLPQDDKPAFARPTRPGRRR
ncbi:Twinfilin-1 [Microbotryomycetes sp. JL221]|nr:Twinfilin-1 [Microbotryomycetes sp. JL221]